MADSQHDIETTNTSIEEDDLELSLSLRPKNTLSSSSKNLLETSSLTKRDAQAIRRYEAKLKRDMKRKAQVFVNNNQQDYDLLERCHKVQNLGFHVAVPPPPPWFGWNAGCFGGGFQGQNGQFASEVKDCASFSSGSSSGISDNNYQSISGTGANSSDAGSHSSHPHSQLPPPSISSTSTQLPPCSSELDLQPNNSLPENSKSQSCTSNKTEHVSSSTPSNKSLEGASTSSNTTSQQTRPSPNNDKDPNTTPRSIIPKEGKGESGRPPRPNGLPAQEKVLFSQMPCVSTTGNGPNGKTITGFLYKYTKAEVSIICVCHGSSFSPAEFVEHAGGVDVEYPLRHIRVVPFALG